MCTKYSSHDSPLYYSVITIYGSFWSACVVHVLPQLLPNLPNLEIQFVLSQQCNRDTQRKSYDWLRDFKWHQLRLLYYYLLCSKLHSSKLWSNVKYLLFCTTQELNCTQPILYTATFVHYWNYVVFYYHLQHKKSHSANTFHMHPLCYICRAAYYAITLDLFTVLTLGRKKGQTKDQNWREPWVSGATIL